MLCGHSGNEEEQDRARKAIDEAMKEES